MARKLYFAYASNMEPRHFRRLCPHGTVVGPARLPGYRLAFSRYSRQRRGGSADVVPDPESEVWGVLYEVDEGDLAAMDRSEGVPAAYHREVVMVVDEAGEERQAVTYLANRTGEFLPHKEYLRVIVQGAEARGLPPEYIEGLKQIRTQ
ncbi:MAG: gamma-glutamylcyclotransferase family protein [Dehalococcoidia bacterium]